MRILVAFILFSLFSLVSHAEYDMLSRRYITGYDFEHRLVEIFGETYSKNSYNYECFQDIKKFGFSQAATGKPLSHEPNADTIKAIKTCYTLGFTGSTFALSFGGRETYIKFFGQFIPASILETKIPNPSGYIGYHSNPLAVLTKEEQALVVAQMVETFLGIDEVILSYGIIKDVNAYRAHLLAKLDQSQSILTVITNLTIELSMRDEFLTY